MVIAKHEDIFVQLGRLLLIQREQVVLGFDLALGFQLLSKLALFRTRTPDRGWVVIRVLVGAIHPLETSELLVGVDLVMILVFFILLLLLLARSAFHAWRTRVFAGPLRRRLPLRPLPLGVRLLRLDFL